MYYILIMISVITGDIINSRSATSMEWLGALKKVLKLVGETPKCWETYRGDSFQAEVTDPKQALYRAIQIKAAIKQFKGLDVRMCIGIGDKNYQASKITESNGSAFVFSGQGLDEFKKSKQHLGVVSPMGKAFDYEINLMIRLMLIAMDNWTPAVAEYVSIRLRGERLQEQIAQRLGISQASVSSRHKRSYLNEILEVETFYRERIKAFKLDI